MIHLAPTVAVVALAAAPLLAQAKLADAPPAAPTPAEVRAGMGIPSTGDVRGQRDTVGFASTAEQMEAAWLASAAPPSPDSLGTAPGAGVAGALCPHDDYLYAGRVYRRVLPLVTARTVVLVGVFHRYRQFGARDAVVFDGFRAWRSPDGDIPVSPMRDEVLAAMPSGTAIQSSLMHESEHSLEALAYWLRHADPDVEILPVIVPAATGDRLAEVAAAFSGALARVMRARGLHLGRDVAVVISSDAVHYGTDFGFTPYGDGGIEAYAGAHARDERILSTVIAGPATADRALAVLSTFVDPAAPDAYRLTWCGRFAIPFGMMVVSGLADNLEHAPARGIALAYSTSVGAPELPLRGVGMGETAPANLYHFVGYPAAAWVIDE